MAKRILVTGAPGQIGSELTPALRARYGADLVVASGLEGVPTLGLEEGGPFVRLDVTDASAVLDVVKRHDVGTIYHLAAILSAVGEENPVMAWGVNVGGLLNVLEAARKTKASVFAPSSIAAFGPTTPGDGTPQVTIQRPTSMYGVTKVAGELLCDYYYAKFGVDARGVRYPGIISHLTPPGGGTTDYAVEIYYDAVKQGSYTSFLEKGTRLDMIYMPDAVRASIELMEADPSRLEHRNAYNVTAMSLSPEEIAASIGRHIPGFKLSYDVDPVRQGIADSWPDRMDDSSARRDWGWKPKYDLKEMTCEMLDALRERDVTGPL